MTEPRHGDRARGAVVDDALVVVAVELVVVVGHPIYDDDDDAFDEARSRSPDDGVQVRKKLS